MEPRGSAPTNWTTVICWSLVAVGTMLLIVFGMRLAHVVIHMRAVEMTPMQPRPDSIRGWMTIPYVARAHGVPEEYLFRRLGIPRNGNRRKALRRLNRENFPGSPGTIRQRLDEAIQGYPPRQGTGRNNP